MTDQERVVGFQTELAALREKYGVDPYSTMDAKRYGEMLQEEPGEVVYRLRQNWTPPQKTSEPPRTES